MSIKEQYRILCKNNPEVPLFSQPEWLDLFGHEWDVLEITHEDQRLFFPFILEKKLGFKIIRNMPMTPYMSAIQEIKNQDGKMNLNDLISRLPKADEYYLDFHPKITMEDWPKENYLIEKHTNYLELNVKDIFSGYKPALQRQIKKAQKNLSIIHPKQFETFYHLYSLSLKQRNVKDQTDQSIMEAIFNFIDKKQCGELTMAIDAVGNAHAVLCCVWDRKCMYYLAGGTDKQFYGSGAMGMLLHDAIGKAKKMNIPLFDFEGSMETGIDRFFKTFGTKEQKYYSFQHRNSKLLQLMRTLREQSFRKI